MDAPRVQGIRFLPIGAIPSAFLRDLVARTSGRLHVPCRIELAPDALPLPHLEGRNQLHADQLLQEVEARVEGKAEVWIGLTSHDIGHPIFTHFFGRARHHGTAAIVSIARLRPDFYGFDADRELLLKRTALEVTHELGHIAGLRHCEDHACIMHFAATVEAIDVRGGSFCASCRGLLPAGLFR